MSELLSSQSESIAHTAPHSSLTQYSLVVGTEQSVIQSEHAQLSVKQLFSHEFSTVVESCVSSSSYSTNFLPLQ